ncbi:hypothetical protein KY092_00955 [Natronomonas gomsonensis]|jgi:hypothetical protein|uniref:DUF5820 family protein n=1 Tax=Natronomonas gomsonensis TaxID=1046043 RepID=UPI0020CA7A79|nr:DUF5820 family protein [Natronomonas gomsonensis]MCY4729120.1 hypothetical protein [Natronomonas gomsonensis]
MLEEAALGDGWQVWNAEDARVILAYRPDVFNGSEFPAACLPTVYVTRGRRNRRPEGNRNLPPNAPWMVTLYLEPEVNRDPDAYDTRSAALDGAVELTHRFADGDIDYRGLYQVPRERYFEKLDELTGRDT